MNRAARRQDGGTEWPVAGISSGYNPAWLFIVYPYKSHAGLDHLHALQAIAQQKYAPGIERHRRRVRRFLSSQAWIMWQTASTQLSDRRYCWKRVATVVIGGVNDTLTVAAAN